MSAHKPVSTPWGPSQTAETIAPGVTFYSTASHGGYHLSGEARVQMPPCLRELPTYAGGPWYEEDCDSAIVVLAFPAHFSERQVKVALEFWERYAPGYRPEFSMADYLATPSGQIATEMARRAA